MLRKMSDPYWFQALGCVLGYDWHSSGVTTTVCGALKDGLKGLEKDLGLFIAGGKGRTSRKTPSEIEGFGPQISVDPAGLVYASRMSAKVDSAALQDGYQLYHHCFFFTRQGSWAVVQQGMNEASRYARRYHWLGEGVGDFVCEPHAAICSEGRGEVLNLVARESTPARTTITAVSTEQPLESTVADLNKLKTLDLPARHQILVGDIRPDRLGKGLTVIYDRQPKGFEELLSLEHVGPKTIRALSLISELIYGVPPATAIRRASALPTAARTASPFPSTARPTTRASSFWPRPSSGRRSTSARRGRPSGAWTAVSAGRCDAAPGRAQSLAFSDLSVSSASATMRSISS